MISKIINGNIYAYYMIHKIKNGNPINGNIYIYAYFMLYKVINGNMYAYYKVDLS